MISLRLSGEGLTVLDGIVRKGEYKDRSEAIRAALSLLAEAQDQDETEEVMVRMSRADLERLRRAKVVQ